MTRRSARSVVVSAVTLWALLGAVTFGQSGARNGEWRTYGGDLGNTRYAPLDQINRDNFNDLEIAWRFKTDSLGPRPEYNFQSTPLMVNGRLYSTAGSRRAVVALDAGTGELLWMHSENEGPRGEAAPRQLSGRGLAYWTDGRDERILYVTPGYRLIALDAKTGVLVPSFGTRGVVDLKLDDDQEIDLVTGEVGLHAAPVVAKDTVIIGAAHLVSFSPKSKTNVKGYVRGYDVRTGKRTWIFHTIPRPESSARRRGTTRPRWRSQAIRACGRRSASTRSSAWSICRWSCRPATSMAGIGQATVFSARASSLSI